jgi:hypothetical protein
MFAKNWLAHDSCWFLAPRSVSTWRRPSNSTRVRGNGLPRPKHGALWPHLTSSLLVASGPGESLSLRLYAVINSEPTEWSDDRHRLRFFMDVCRVQEARHRKGLPDFPCKKVGIVDARISWRIDNRLSRSSTWTMDVIGFVESCDPSAFRDKWLRLAQSQLSKHEHRGAPAR